MKTGPLAYTETEGGPWLKWNPEGNYHSLVWEDGTRWDEVNGFNTTRLTPEEIEKLKATLE